MRGLILTVFLTWCAAAPAGEWRRLPGHEKRQFYYADGSIRAVWDQELKEFREIDPATGFFRPPSLPPWQAERDNFGVRLDLIPRGERAWTGAGPVTGANPESAPIEGLPNDADLPRVLVFGTESKAKPVMQQFAPGGPLAHWTTKAVVQWFRPDEWQARLLGYEVTADPCIYFTTAAGEVLGHRDGAPADPAELDDALSQADAKKRPELYPRLQRRGLSALLEKIDVPGVAVVAGLVVFVVYLVRRGGKQTQ